MTLSDPEWFDRYSARSEDAWFPSRWAARTAHAEQVGADGRAVLCGVAALDAPGWLRELPAVELLRRTWVQQFQVTDGKMCWRDKKDLPPAAMRYCSPYDQQARTGTKRDTSWNGYKVHLTETCEPDAPHLITQVATTPAPVPDMAMTAAIHSSLAARDLLPAVHLVDAGYVDADHMVAARDIHGVELLGPAKSATGWQAAACDGYTLEDFTIDWDNQRVTCPNGATTTQWNPDQPAPSSRPTSGNSATNTAPVSKAPSPKASARSGCADPATAAWPKIRLQHLLTAAGINLNRLNAWLDDTPLAPTRTSHFAALRPAA